MVMSCIVTNLNFDWDGRGIFNDNSAGCCAQVPDNCGWDFENRCVVANEEDAEDLKEDFPDAIVEVNEELLSSIPDEDQEDIDEMEG
jgi:hypothetical protein